MTSPSKVLVVSRDRRAADGMRLGFEREGMDVAQVDSAASAAFTDVAVVIAGADPGGQAGGVEPAALIKELVARAAAEGAPPLLYVGNGISRGAALAAGATAVLAAPAYVRDVVTIGRILAGRRPGNRSVMDGDLGQSFGVFYLVRALTCTGATGTLLMLRGLRRGEIRFFEGEVTSAQVGGLHGQAALHQLLLWTEARFELRHEPVVRRQQIPLTNDELLGHAEQFLCDLRDAAGSLSPSTVYEQDPTTVAAMGRQLPTEVHGVLRMFDGHRTVADVLEDSPFRVLETLRVAERAAQVGLLRKLVLAKARSTHRAMLAIEEWLVGGGAGEVARPVTPEGSGPVGGGKHKKKGKRTSGQQAVVAPKAVVEVDWAALVPRSVGLDSGALSPVVPSSVMKGEIQSRAAGAAPSRESEREKLETLTSAGERDRLFSSLVEVAEKDQLDAEEQEWLASEQKARVALAEAERQAKLDADAKAKAEADAKAKAAADAKAKAEADAKAKAEADAKAKAEADAKAKAEADAKAKAEADAKAKAEADADAKAEADAKAQAEADAKAKAEADAKAKAEADAKAKAEADAKAKAEADAKAKARRDEVQAETSGEIRPRAKTSEPPVTGPSILIDDVIETRTEATSIAAAAIAAAATTPAPTVEVPAPKIEVPAPAVEAAAPAVAPKVTVELAPATIEAAVQAAVATVALPAPAIDEAAASEPKPAEAAPTAPDSVEVAHPTPRAAAKEADQARSDAQAAAAAVTAMFSDDEEEFFRAGHEPHHQKHSPAESFDDLDVGYQRVGFWDKLLGRRGQAPPRAAATRTAPPAAKAASAEPKAAPAESKPGASGPKPGASGPKPGAKPGAKGSSGSKKKP